MADDLDKVRKDYEELFGKRPFNGWDIAELQKRIDEKLAGGSDPEPEKPAPKAAKVSASSDPYPTQADLDAMRAGIYVDRELKTR